MDGSSNDTARRGGIGLSAAVFLVFLFLKLAGIGVVATWSWWWVTSPLWIPYGLVLAFIAFCYLAVIAASVLDNLDDRKRKKR